MIRTEETERAEVIWQAMHDCHAAGRAAERADVRARLAQFRRVAVKAGIGGETLRQLDMLDEGLGQGLHEGMAVQ
jgi:hypothetical protein